MLPCIPDRIVFTFSPCSGSKTSNVLGNTNLGKLNNFRFPLPVTLSLISKDSVALSAFLLIQTALLAQDCKTQSTDNYGEDSVNCRKNFALYTGYLKQKNYEDAAIFWGKTQQKCPQSKSNLYANGAYIFFVLTLFTHVIRILKSFKRFQ